MLCEINATVDFILLTIANRALPENERITVSSMSRTRQRSIIEIEKLFNVSLVNLPGWHYVDEVRDNSNSLKHRSGLNLPKLWNDIPTTSSVILEPQDIKLYIRNVRCWLYALADIVSAYYGSGSFA